MHPDFQFGDAIENDRLDEVRTYLENGYSPTARVLSTDNHGNEITMTPLGLAWDSMEMIELLISYGADVDTDLDFIFEIIYNRELADRFSLDFNKQDEFGNTPLHHAAHYYYCDGYEITKWLLTKQININIQNEEGETPLHISIACCDDIFYLLLEAGADTSIRNNAGFTPKEYAESLLTGKNCYHHDELQRIIDRLIQIDKDDDLLMIKSAID